MSLKNGSQLRQQQQKNNIVLLLQDLVRAYQVATMSRKWLMEQDLSKLDVTKLHPLSPEVISRQATINWDMPMQKNI